MRYLISLLQTLLLLNLQRFGADLDGLLTWAYKVQVINRVNLKI